MLSIRTGQNRAACCTVRVLFPFPLLGTAFLRGGHSEYLSTCQSAASANVVHPPHGHARDSGRMRRISSFIPIHDIRMSTQSIVSEVMNHPASMLVRAARKRIVRNQPTRGE